MCSMNKQCKEGVQKCKRFNLITMDSKRAISMLDLQFDYWLGHNIFPVKKKRGGAHDITVIAIGNEWFGLLVLFYQPFSGHLTPN